MYFLVHIHKSFSIGYIPRDIFAEFQRNMLLKEFSWNKYPFAAS